MTEAPDTDQEATDSTTAIADLSPSHPMKSFTEATEAFLDAATWLTASDLPMVTALQQAALELDTNGVQAALLNTYGVTYRTLLKSASHSNAVDEDEDFLNGP